MGAVFGLFKHEHCAPVDNFAPVLYVAFEHFLNVHLLGSALV